jgi:hypothetical protein
MKRKDEASSLARAWAFSESLLTKIVPEVLGEGLSFLSLLGGGFKHREEDWAS